MSIEERSVTALTTGNAMVKQPDSVGPSTSVARALELLQLHGVHFLPVCDNGRLIGEVTAHELRRALLKSDGSDSALISECQLKVGPTISPEFDLAEALEVMKQAGRRHLCVTNGDALVGVLSQRAALRRLRLPKAS